VSVRGGGLSVRIVVFLFVEDTVHAAYVSVRGGGLSVRIVVFLFVEDTVHKADVMQ
jgi:hypothetical protein